MCTRVCVRNKLIRILCVRVFVAVAVAVGGSARTSAPDPAADRKPMDLMRAE